MRASRTNWLKRLLLAMVIATFTFSLAACNFGENSSDSGSGNVDDSSSGGQQQTQELGDPFETEMTFYIDRVAMNMDSIFTEFKYVFATDGTFERITTIDPSSPYGPAFAAAVPNYSGTYGLNEDMTKIKFCEPMGIEVMTDDQTLVTLEYDFTTLEDGSYFFTKNHETNVWPFYSNPDMFESAQPFEYPEELGTKVIFDKVQNYTADTTGTLLEGMNVIITFDADDGAYTFDMVIGKEKGAYSLVYENEVLKQIKMLIKDGTPEQIVTCDVTVYADYNTLSYNGYTFYSDASKIPSGSVDGNTAFEGYPSDQLGEFKGFSETASFKDTAYGDLFTLAFNADGSYTGSFLGAALEGAYTLVYDGETLTTLKMTTTDAATSTVTVKECPITVADGVYTLTYDAQTLKTETATEGGETEEFVYPTDWLGEKSMLMMFLPETLTFTNGIGVWTYKLNNDGSYTVKGVLGELVMESKGAWNLAASETERTYTITFVEDGKTETDSTWVLVQIPEGEALDAPVYYTLTTTDGTVYYSDPAKIPTEA